MRDEQINVFACARTIAMLFPFNKIVSSLVAIRLPSGPISLRRA